MHMVTALLLGAADVDGSRKRADLVQDLLWAHTDPADRLEHIRVRPHWVGLEAVFLLSSAYGTGVPCGALALLGRASAPLAAQGYTPLQPAE
ncbi:hypothetical protein [Streptomyces sp. NPDC086023]|uniref:hypothetical protein n=1 Tax=Streptomyces sp. NPDC086023 TaxID=3365746 RepID=UPI0037CD0710